MSIAVFTWFRYHPFKAGRLARIAAVLSKYCFGAYLIHAMVIEQLLFQFKIDTFSINPLFSIPILGLLVFAVSMSVSVVLNHIPIIKKYCV